MMKINSIGINAYQQAMERPQNEAKTMAERKPESAPSNSVHIPSQINKIGSRLGVKLQAGTFADMLSPEEKEAISRVFEKFRQVSAPDGSYRNDGGVNKKALGNFVDVTL